MRTRIRTVGKIVGIATVLGLVVLIVTLWPRHRPTQNLIARSQRVAVIEFTGSYYWLSADELLVTTRLAAGQSYPYTFRLDLVNRRTGEAKHLTGLEGAIAGHSASSFSRSAPFATPPSGDWLMLVRQDAKDGGMRPGFARMDGSGFYESAIPADSSRSWRWVDATTWVSRDPLLPRDDLVIHDVMRRRPDRRTTETSAEGRVLTRLFIPAHGDLVAVPFANDSATLLIDARSPNGATGAGAMTRVATLRFPPGSKLVSAPNQNATRVLILASEPRNLIDAHKMQQVAPSLVPYVAPYERLYVYRLDTRRLVEIGGVDDAGSVPEIINPGWLPDNRHVQFFYHNAVYVVDTE